MTLALLLTAVGGAWAQTETLLTTITATAKDTYSETTTGVVTVKPSNMRRYDSTYGWLWSRSSGSGSVTVEAKEGYTITKCVFKQNDKDPVTITTSPFAITFNEDGRCVQNDDMDGVTSIEVYGYAPEPAIKVTTDAAEEGATFTEASFEMPTYDVAVNYELVRDMSVQMQAQVGDDPDKQPRYRVKKEDNVFKPADLSPAQVMALFSVNDQIEQKVLTPTTDYIVNIYAIDEEGQPTGNPMTFADFTFEPGIYAVKAVAAEGSPYDGESALSNKFVLFQGYEVYVPAGEYVTYYRNEALRVDEADKENFKLYTVSSVSGDKATLSNAFDAAPSNTPFLVYNNTNESKTVLLIPCTEPDLALTVADQFQGTMEEKMFTDADMAAADYYVCNGKQFVKVRGAGTLGANMAYLKFVTNQQLSAPQYISISGDLGEGTTGVDASLVNSEEVNSVWYDLNGRRLQGKPAQKGIYIKNGKKVIVK